MCDCPSPFLFHHKTYKTSALLSQHSSLPRRPIYPSSFASLSWETFVSLFVFWGLSSHWVLTTLRPSENRFLPVPASSSLQPIPAGTSEPAAALAFHPSDPCQSSPLLSEKKQKHSSPSPKASSGAALLGMSSSCHHFEAMSRESGLGPPHSEGASSTSTFSCVLRQQVQETDIGTRSRN